MKFHPVVHFEMPYEDSKRVSDFYKKVFDWGMQESGEDMGNYVVAHTTETDENMMVKTPGNINGGFFSKDQSDAKYPSVVVQVEDINEYMKKIEEAGGKVLGKPADIPGVGAYVSFTDTEGNRASILEPPKK